MDREWLNIFSFLLNILSREGYCSRSLLECYLFPLTEAKNLINMQLEKQQLPKKQGAVRDRWQRQAEGSPFCAGSELGQLMRVVGRVERLPFPLLCIAWPHVPCVTLRLAPKLLPTVANPQLMAHLRCQKE